MLLILRRFVTVVTWRLCVTRTHPSDCHENSTSEAPNFVTVYTACLASWRILVTVLSTANRSCVCNAPWQNRATRNHGARPTPCCTAGPREIGPHTKQISVVGPPRSMGWVQRSCSSLMFFVVVLASAIDTAVSVIVVVTVLATANRSCLCKTHPP